MIAPHTHIHTRLQPTRVHTEVLLLLPVLLAGAPLFAARFGLVKKKDEYMQNGGNDVYAT